MTPPLKSLMIALSLLSILTITPSKALIPFTQAKGMLTNTKDEYKAYSPFWAMVAVHGKMLETIRFYGNYKTLTIKERDEDGVERNHEVDQGQDPIAALIKRLFNSPDGVQFVVTSYEADPVGNLSRHLETVDPIIQILLSSSKLPEKVKHIKEILDKIVDITIENVNPKDYSETVRNLVERYLSAKNPADPQEESIQNYITQWKHSVLANEEQQFLQLDDTELSQRATEEGIPIPSVMPKSARNVLIKIILDKIGGDKAAYVALSDNNLRQLAQENSIDFNFKDADWRQEWRSTLLKKLMSNNTRDNTNLMTMEALKSFASENKLSYDETKSPADLISLFAAELRQRGAEFLVSSLDTKSFKKALQAQMEEDNEAFAKLLVKAFDEQAKRANPQDQANYLYPENVVITALLSFFVKVANDQNDLKLLPTLMKEDWQPQPEFSSDDYFKLKEQYISDKVNPKLNQYILNNVNPKLLEDPELAFLMEKGYEAYEMTFVQPINYTNVFYEGKVFPDCGETSLLNVLGIFLSANNGGTITPETLNIFNRQITDSSTQELSINHPFTKMLSFFNKNSKLSEWSKLDVHNQWANIVSNLNDPEKPFTIDSIQYGRGTNGADQPIYEIKSFVHPEVRGIVNMFNVIAHLIPDKILNEPWDSDRTKRIHQVTQKLDRLCEILSRERLSLSWHNDFTKNKNIEDEFPFIVFKNYNEPVFRWRFLQGHFQLDPLSKSTNDWRVPYHDTHEHYFQNDWMASLFLKLLEEDWIYNKNYGSKFPLAFIFNQGIRGLDGTMMRLNFVFYRVIQNKKLLALTSLSPRWIEKSILLNDVHALNRISWLIYAVKDQNIPAIQSILSNPRFAPIQQTIREFENIPMDDDFNLLQQMVNPLVRYNNPNQLLRLMSEKKLKSFTTLNLNSNNMIHDDILEKLIGLKKLYLGNNKTITDRGIKNLSNLTTLSLNNNDKITDDGIKNLTNLTTLFLIKNKKITDKGINNLPNLTTLSLKSNRKITDKAIDALRKRNLNINIIRR